MARHASETFRHGTATGRNGNTLFDAPIEIRDQEDLDNYRISWEDCITIRFGRADQRIVYIIRTPDRRLAEYLWQDMNQDHDRKVAAGRCMIPGKRSVPIRCPKTFSCSDCPYGRAEEKWKTTPLSWEQLTENAFEKEWVKDDADSPCETISHFRLLLDEMREELDKTDPRLMIVLRMKEIEGYSVKEIAEALGCSQPRVYQLLDAAKEKAGKWLAE